MFYSNTMLSRKGPLKNIWEAAYCFNKLKKDEITCTNIPSSIDTILPADVQIPYRVLSQLLLGIVKIFSKKVDILYHDCNEALVKVSMSIIPKEATGTRQRKGANHDATITIPERFELDSFDLGIQEDGDTAELHQENIMEGIGYTLAFILFHFEYSSSTEETMQIVNETSINALSADRSPHSSLYESYRRDTAELAELTSACLTPLADVLPSFKMDIDVEINNLSNSSSSEAEGGEFPEDSYDAEEYDNNDGRASSHKHKHPSQAYKQRFQLVVKKKPVLDETVLLPNESFIHEINDTSNLLRKRRKVPSSSLDVWKASRRANVQKVFMEPLLTGLSSKLKDLYKDKLPDASSPDLLAEPVDSQNVAEPGDIQNVVEPADLQTEMPDEPSKTVPDRENISLDNPIPETPNAPTAVKVYAMELIDLNSSPPNSELDMMDGDFGYHGDDNNEEGAK
ncbi:hypothetical protein J5N97_021025 [Dioscorea zingiberensis]|uniref:Rad21/Rec8-like protein N-terminal domain-containing protein n=1 Tax=Dioscorea zingiberensis TaxID=325984 RepID=A0A9D5HDV6_9LILI|nr:hypothetical protein J5N97_021025 [Dioscorea zingiberensis]